LAATRANTVNTWLCSLAVCGAIAWAKGQEIGELVVNMVLENESSWSLAESVGMLRTSVFANPKNRYKEAYIYRLQL
jgi:hypothetical protein